MCLLCYTKHNFSIINNKKHAFSQQVEAVRALCKACGLDNKGSKTDLVVRLQQKMSNRVTYNKVFQKVWGASGE